MSYTISTATSEDVPEVVALVNGAYRGEGAKQGWTTEADILDGQRTDAKEVNNIIKNEYLRIARDSETGKLISCARLAPPSVDEGHKRLYIGMLTVEPTLQGKGIAKLMLDDAYEFASSLQLQGLIMTVISMRTELIAYYERRGFRKTDKAPEPFPYGQPQFGLPKVEGLEFIEMVRD